jgi:hypothetical protein
VALFGVALFPGAACVVEGAELDGDAGADADEGGESALVEGRCTFVLEDAGGAGEGRRVLRCGLKADFDNVFNEALVPS